MTLTRRSLIKTASLLAAGGLGSRLSLCRVAFGTESAPGGVLVVVHLRGGCDGLNLLSPSADPNFIAARSSELRVAADGHDAGHLVPHAQDAALEFRLHDAAGALAELSDAKRLAFVHAAGLTDTTRSHFVATDMIEHGVADGAALNRTDTGWLTRALAAAGGSGAVRSVSTSAAPSGAWAGNRDTFSVGDLGAGVSPPGGTQAGNVLQQLYGVGPPAGGGAAEASLAAKVGAAGRVTLAAMNDIDRRLNRDARGKPLVYAPEPGVNYEAANEFGRPLKSLAQLIKMDVGVQAATVDLGGWDTHEYQPGRFRGQVDRLSRGLGAFYDDMVKYRSRAVIVVVTEFGRRLRSNRSNGTDHGRGSVMMVLGDHVDGGKIHGRWPGLGAEQLEEGVDLAVVNDYRAVFSDVLGTWQGGSHAAPVFPGFEIAGRGSPRLHLFTDG